MPPRAVPTQPSRRCALGALCALGAAGFSGVRAQERKPPHHTLPEVLERQLVNTQLAAFEGRDCVAVELTDEVQARVSGAGANSPSFAVVDRSFENGILEVDLAAQINGKGTADVRGFVGLAFHISADIALYEAVYLRMSNGRLNRPPPAAPRIDRAIQYVAHPHLHFPVTREKSPGLYERGADVELGRWHRLRLEIDGPSLRAFIDGVPTLSIDNLAYANRRGPVGLWVGEGSRALFSDFTAWPA